MTMEPSSVEMQKQLGLMDLKPTEGSKPWLLQQGRTKDAKVMDEESKVIKEKLRNFDSTTVTENEIIDSLEKSAQSGDPDFYESVLVRAHYDDIRLELPLPMIFFKESVFRNAAVLKRDEARDKQKAGLVDEAGTSLELAKTYYNNYTETRSEKADINSVPNKQGIDLTAYGENIEMVDMLFSEMAIAAVNKKFTIIDKIIQGGEVEGLTDKQRKLIKVSIVVHPNKKLFPEVYEAVGALDNLVAESCGITVEEMLRYQAFALKAIEDSYKK